MPLTAAERQRRYRQKLKYTHPEKFQEQKKKNSERTLRRYKNKTANYSKEQKEDLIKYVCEPHDKMPLTAAERQRRYRQKLKSTDPEKFLEQKMKNSERTLRQYKNKTANYSKEQKEELRRKWREDRKKKEVMQCHVKQKFQNDIIHLQRKLSVMMKGFTNLQRKVHRQQMEIEIINKKYENVMMNFYVPTENIKPLDPLIVENPTPILGTMKIHHLRKIQNQYRGLSCFCKDISEACACHSPKYHDYSTSIKIYQSKQNRKRNKSSVNNGNTAKISLEKVKRHRNQSISSSKDDTDVEIKLAESDADDEFFSDVSMITDIVHTYENVPDDSLDKKSGIFCQQSTSKLQIKI